MIKILLLVAMFFVSSISNARNGTLVNQGFISGGGSGSATYNTLVKLEVISRNIIEFATITTDVGHTDSTFNVDRNEQGHIDTYEARVNCKNKTYAIYGDAKDGQSTRSYLAASTYRWIDEPAVTGDFYPAVSNYSPERIKFFNYVCNLAQ